MRKPVLLLAAFAAIAFSSCQKTSSNKTYTCSCNYTWISGHVATDSTQVTTYPAGTSSSDASTNCTNQQNQLQTAGIANARCLLGTQ